MTLFRPNTLRTLRALCVSALMVLTGPVLAGADPDGDGTTLLKDGHPHYYVVKRGDTLWDIAGMFLKDAWRWQEVWRANPSIRNPDLIYPGDQITLVNVDGETRLQVTRRGKAVVKLSPKIREVAEREIIGSFNAENLKKFISLPRVVDQDEFAKGAYVLKAEDEHMMMGQGDRVYVRGLHPDQGREHGVFRLGQAYKDPVTREVIGYEANRVADVYVEEWGDPSIVRITKSNKEVIEGMKVLPNDPQDNFATYTPRSADPALRGEVLAFVDGLTEGAINDSVVLSLGRKDGVERGQVFGLYRGGKVIVDKRVRKKSSFFDFSFGDDEDDDEGSDKYNKTPQAAGIEHLEQGVKLPMKRIGLAMVFRVYKQVSYAMIVSSDQHVRVGQVAKAP